MIRSSLDASVSGGVSDLIIPVGLVVILLLVATTAAAYGVKSEVRARRINRRRREIGAAEDFMQSAILGAGATGVSLYEVYAASDDHEQVLDALQQRFTEAIPENASPLEWAGYLGEKADAGGRSLGGLVSAWVGELAEEKAIAYYNSLPELKEQGIQAVRFDDPTHPDTDIRFVDSQGNAVDMPEVQCKSYGDASDFLAKVDDYAGRGSHVNHYVVNSETYAQLDQSGKLGELAAKGITVDDGGWSHNTLVNTVEETVGDFSEATDVAEDIPFVALAMFGFKLAGTVRSVAQGKASFHEGSVDVAVDAMRLGVGGAAAMAGAKAGAVIGSFLVPGIGTVIGGGIGAISAAFAAGRVARWIKEKWKYGALKDCLEQIGNEFTRTVQSGTIVARNLETNVFENVYGGGTLTTILHQQEQLAHKFLPPSPENNAQITPAATLVNLHRQEAFKRIGISRRAARRIPEKLIALSSSSEGDNQMQLLGELVAANSKALATGVTSLNRNLAEYRVEIEKYPHHPYRFKGSAGSLNSQDVFATVCAETAAEEERNIVPFKEPPPRTNRGVLVVALLLLAGAGAALATGAVVINRTHLFTGFQMKQQPFLPVQPKSVVTTEAEKLPDPGRHIKRVLVVKVRRSNCRRRPSMRSKLVRRLRRSTELVKLSDRKSWVKVQLTDGTACWINKRLVGARRPSPSPQSR